MAVRHFVIWAAIGALLAGCTSSGSVVNPPAGPTVSVDEVSNFGGTFTTVAYQSSPNGAWQVLPGSQQFQVGSSGAYGVAWICGSDPTEVNIYQATSKETSTPIIECDGSSGLPATLSGTTSETGFSTATATDIFVQDDGTGASPNGTYSVATTSTEQDVFAGLYDGSTLLAAKVYPAVNLTTGSATQDVSFAASDALGSSVSATAGTPPSGETLLDVYADYINVPQDSGVELAYSVSSPLSYPSIAAGDTGVQDTYGVIEEADSSTNLNVGLVFNQTPPTSVSLTSAFALSVTASTTPVYDLDYTGFSGLSGGFTEYGIVQEDTTSGVVGYATVTAGYVTASGSTNYSFPNITLSGFPTMTIAAGANVDWLVGAAYGPLFTLDAFSAIPLSESHSSHAQSLPSLPSAFARFTTAGRAAPQSNTTTGTLGSYYAALVEGAFTAP